MAIIVYKMWGMDFEFYISVDSMSQDVSMGHINTFQYGPKWPWQSFEVLALNTGEFSLILQVSFCCIYCTQMAEILHVPVNLEAL